jgi:hypothetical protein
MSSRRLVVPQFATAPSEYSADYMSNVVRSFSVFLQQFINPGDGRATTLTLTNLETSDTGLEIGALFQQDGFLKITLAYKPHPYGVSATSAVGQVSVTTT